MASGSAQHPWRCGGHRSHGDEDDDDEPEVDAGTHSDTTDTEEYYNRCSILSDDETISGAVADDGGETASSVLAPANATSSVARGWGGTGRRGCTGSSVAAAARAAAPVSPVAEPEQPVAAIVAAVPDPEVVVFHPTPPLAFPAHGGGAMEVTVASVAAIANDPPTQAIVDHHQEQPSTSPAIVVGQAPKVYTCKRCGMTFTNPQALGGHVVGHRNRDLAAAAAGTTTMSAADGVVFPGGRRGAPKPPERRAHVCNECGAEFVTGVQLGGHKRKHYTGEPIVPKRKNKTRVVVHVQPALSAAAAEAVGDITLALSVKGDDVALPAVWH
ncbi:hypothetical protein HU200_027994 [Digitaria exilis]|uniref:C2H2-type domain-containing protein n=1 Tax=Digitaria exilis TaxID=1010633 RepID=A0A835C4D4_9POAL|nr:hypothetical protein HU200_027994 [Digitaria exilis]CAB3451844.1 unnamed protein product [Digitaria exilis]